MITSRDVGCCEEFVRGVQTERSEDRISKIQDKSEDRLRDGYPVMKSG